MSGFLCRSFVCRFVIAGYRNVMSDRDAAPLHLSKRRIGAGFVMSVVVESGRREGGVGGGGGEEGEGEGRSEVSPAVYISPSEDNSVHDGGHRHTPSYIAASPPGCLRLVLHGATGVSAAHRQKVCI